MTSKKNSNRFMEELGSQPAPDPAPSGPMPGAAQIFPGKGVNLPIPSQGNALVKDGQIKIGGFVLTGTGLQITGAATKQDWSQVGDLLFKLEGSIQWLIGDWLAYGEDVKWGDIPEIAERIGKEVKTLYNYRNYSKAIKSSLRREDLSYTHHMLVSGFEHDEDISVALAYAAENKLSVSDFRRWLKQWTSGEEEQTASALPSGPTFGDASSDLDKYRDRDFSTLKSKERTLLIGRLTEMKRMISDYERRLGIGGE